MSAVTTFPTAQTSTTGTVARRPASGSLAEVGRPDPRHAPRPGRASPAGWSPRRSADNWWKQDPFLSSEARARRDEELEQENRVLRARLDRLEAALGDQLPEIEDEDLASATRPPVQRGGLRRAGHPEVLERLPDDP